MVIVDPPATAGGTDIGPTAIREFEPKHDEANLKIMETFVRVWRLSFRITHHFLKGIESCVEFHSGSRLRY